MGDCSSGALYGEGTSIESRLSENYTAYIEFLAPPVTDMRESCFSKNLDESDGFTLHYSREDFSVRMEAKMVYEGEGGGYYAWCPNEFEALWRHNVGAAKLFLSTNGLALPCYSDSPKVAYVLQGGGVADVILPGKEEKVVAIRKGDAIALPVGVVTWWYNKDATELEILFLGDTKTATKMGSFKDIFTGFLPEFVCRAWNRKESVLRTLIGPQLAKSIIKLDPGFEMPEPKQDQRDGMLLNCEEAASSHFDINGGGDILVLNTENLPTIGDIGLSASHSTLSGSSAYYPDVSGDPAIRVTYIVKGSGTVRVRYVGGIIADRHIEAGELFVVPRLLKVLIIADPDGMEWFSIVTNEKPNHYFSLGFWGLLTEASIPMSSSSPGCS